MVIKNIRESLNESARNLGNKLTPRLGEHGIGFGDFLASDINFRKIGATAGVLSPLAGWYAFNYPDAGPIVAAVLLPANVISTLPVTFFASVLGGTIGYKLGERVDSVFGYKPQENRILYTREQIPPEPQNGLSNQ